MKSQVSASTYTFDRVVRIVGGLLIFVALMMLINYLKSVLLPFLVACLIAYMFEPFVQFNRRLLHLRGRTIAVLVTLFEAAFFVMVVCYFLVPMVFEEMHRMADVLRRYSQTHAEIRYLPAQVHDFLRRHIDFNGLSEVLLKQDWSAIVERTLHTGWMVITGSISLLMAIFSWLVVVLYVVFVMIDYDRLSRGIRSMFPRRHRKVVFKIARDIKMSMNRYFRGQALVAAIVGVLFAIGFYIVGIPMAVVLGLFIGVLNMVPYLQLISIVPTTLLCLIYAAGGGGDFWTIFWECIAVYAVVQVIQDMILTPKIMGKAMGLNPAIILLSLSVWGTLLGLVGLIIALPLTTLLISYYNEYILRREHTDERPGEGADE